MSSQDTVEFDCAATDVCNLKASYLDYDVDLAPAHDCMMQKVPVHTYGTWAHGTSSSLILLTHILSLMTFLKINFCDRQHF